MCSRNLLFKLFLRIFLLIFFFLTPGYASGLTMQWDAYSDPNLAGYKVYYDTNPNPPYNGFGAQEGNSPIDMSLAQDENPDPNVVEFTLNNLPEGNYYVAVTAYNNEVPPLESDYLNDVNIILNSDTSAPTISNIRVSYKSNTVVVIEWTTDKLSDSVVQYDTSSSSWGSYPSNKSNGSLVTSHSITLTGLNGSTTYYYRVGSTDGDNNGPTISNEARFTTDSTTDITPPVISSILVTSKTDTSAVIEWTTDELSDSVVQYGTGDIYYTGESSISLVNSHIIKLTGLDPNTTYNFRVFTADVSGNSSTLSGMSFTTDSIPDVTTPVISNVRVASKSDITAVIEWTTDEESDSVLKYGTIPSSWANYSYIQSNGSMVTNHSITLNGLNSNTTYYFQVGSKDAADNGPSISNELTFTTDPPPDTTPPVITNVRVLSKTHDSAIIEWTTDELSDNAVQYGTGSSTWGSYPSNQNGGSMVTNHSITLNGLNGSTTYYFRVGSKDAANNGPTISNEVSFITEIPPPFMLQFPTIDYANTRIDVTFSESNMQNTTAEANYTFSPSLLFRSLGGSDDIVSLGNNTYRLSMSSIPNYLIYTLTVSNVTDAANNTVSPNSIRINDNDNDGMADDWETAIGVYSPSGDSDGDGLNNLEEYNNSTNPNDSDTDGDNLPDGWEVTYGLDPNDNTGANGGNGDPDGDTWTNYEEYLSGYRPNSDTFPKAKAPKIKKTIPRDKSGVNNKKRVPIDTSFAVRIQDPDGIDITDTTSIKFTVDDGMNTVYERDLSDTDVVRVVKLTEDADTKVKNAWVVYDRSLDPLGNFDYGTDVNIKVDVRDKRGTTMPQESYDFNIETTTEHDLAQVTRPETISSSDSGMTTLTVANNAELDGFQIVYDNTEPIIPLVEPLDEIPSLNLPYVRPVAQPVKLGPPNVFNNPVTLIVPVSGEGDVKDMGVYLFDGIEWVYAVSSYNSGGVIQPGGEDWVVPGSLSYDDTGAMPVLEIQVYHFSGIQAGFYSGPPVLPVLDLAEGGGGSGGGCFIDTMSYRSPFGWLFPSKKNQVHLWLSAIVFLILLLLVGGTRHRKSQGGW